MLSSYSGIFVFGSLPFALAFPSPRPVVSNTDDYQSNTFQTDDGSGSANSSSLAAPPSATLPRTLAVSPWITGDGNRVTNDPRAIAEALVLFVLFALIVLAVYWFGPALRRQLLGKAGKERVTGPGFGFDGLTRAQLKTVRLQEKEEGMKGEWFIKLPVKPPTIALKEFPLPPIQMPAGILGRLG